MSTLERAIAISAAAHAGQVDLAGQPYILHPLRVMQAMETDAGRIVAVLHDLFEDCPPWSIEDLIAGGFDPELATAVNRLTRRADQPYTAYIDDLVANGPPLAQAVKIADLRDNLLGERVGRLTLQQQRKIEVRYRPALQRLTECPEAWGF